MTVIAGSADLLLRRSDLPNEKRQRYLEAIVETTERATRLTSHLLAFGRRQPIRPEVIDFNVRLDAVAEMLARTLGSHIEVALELGPALGHVEVDPAELETALLNVAFNARDAMSGGGRLVIFTSNRREGDRDLVCVSMTDSGSGMPKEVLERAFEPFFTTKAVGKGTGLGLSQIHGFAAQAGGRAEVESTQGVGTTVRIILPRSDKKLTATPSERASSALPPGLRVLVVEDNDEVREFAENLLGELHCQVTSAANADQALGMLETQAVDILFSDVVMPGMSGVELARRVRGERPEQLILLASGYSDEIVGAASLDFEVIRKPYGADSLAEAFCRLLDATREQAA